MKYIITGSLGNISKPLAQSLVKAGHDVMVISSKNDKVAAIESIGAKAAIGSVEDVNFLTNTFKGADAVYTMVPPNFGAANWKQYIAGIGKNYAEAIRNSGVKNIVNLSSIGAHMADGCGPVSGIFHVENALNALENVNVLHLRAGYFYPNFMANIGMIKHMGILGSNYGSDVTMTLVDTNDIADVAARELQNLTFKGKSHVYVVSEEKTTKEIAQTLGASISKPELPWIEFKDEDAMGGMLQSGLPAEIAKNFVEMGTAIRSGAMVSDYVNNRPATLGKTKLADFAKVFAGVYSAS